MEGEKMQRIHARTSVSISDLKKNPSGIISQSQGEPVVILNHNRPTAYLVPAAAFEALMEQLDDLDLVRLVKERESEPSVKVKLDEL
jgi:prevent-host-death family protein